MRIKTTYHIPTEEIKIDLGQIAKVMGYEDASIPESFEQMFLEYIEEAKPLLEAKAELKVVEPFMFNDNDYSVVVGSKTFILHKVVFSMLKNSNLFVLFICTVGDKISNLAKENLLGTDPLKGFVMDTIGSLAVESAIDYVHQHLGNELLKKRINITNRYSPGYCLWDVSEQKKLFSLFDSTSAGVTLTASCLMQPVKSVSGIIGAGEDVKYYQYNCKMCQQKGCIFSNNP